MALQLSPSGTEAIRQSLPAVAAGGVNVTSHFYGRLLGNHPELQNTFNSSNQVGLRQPLALFNSVAAAGAAAINDKGPKTLPPVVVNIIAHKHCALNITQDLYDIVGTELLGTIVDLLKPGQDILDGWAELYGKIVALLSDREEELYQESEKKPGGWRFQREFIVQKRVEETKEMTSFYLVPKDGGEVPLYLPGQYTTVWVKGEDWEYRQPRHYTLSDSPNGKHFRISVRREGKVSGWLHEHATEGSTLLLSPPYGCFTLTDANGEGDSDVVLLSASNGITPCIAMLNTLITKHEASGVLPNIHWFHHTTNKGTHSFREHIQSVAEHHKNFRANVWYAEPDAEAVKGTDYHFEGRFSLDEHREHIDKPSSHYYFCGPRAWMAAVRETLVSWGVTENRMHTEVFGPALAEKRS